MKRRTLLRTFGTLGLPGSLVACGGGGGSPPPPPAQALARIDSVAMDQPGYFVGDSAKITVQFTGTSARLEPGGIAVTNGTAVSIGPLATSTTYTVVVSGTQSEAKQDIHVPVAYRHTFTPLPMASAPAQH